MRKHYCCNYSIIPVDREIVWHVWHNLSRCALFLTGLPPHLPFHGILSCEMCLPPHFHRIPLNRNTFGGLTVLSWLIHCEFLKRISGSFNILFSSIFLPQAYFLYHKEDCCIFLLLFYKSEAKKANKRKKKDSCLRMAASALPGDGAITVLLCSGSTMFPLQNIGGCQLWGVMLAALAFKSEK